MVFFSQSNASINYEFMFNYREGSVVFWNMQDEEVKHFMFLCLRMFACALCHNYKLVTVTAPPTNIKISFDWIVLLQVLNVVCRILSDLRVDFYVYLISFKLLATNAVELHPTISEWNIRCPSDEGRIGEI